MARPAGFLHNIYLAEFFDCYAIYASIVEVVLETVATQLGPINCIREPNYLDRSIFTCAKKYRFVCDVQNICFSLENQTNQNLKTQQSKYQNLQIFSIKNCHTVVLIVGRVVLIVLIVDLSNLRKLLSVFQPRLLISRPSFIRV